MRQAVPEGLQLRATTPQPASHRQLQALDPFIQVLALLQEKALRIGQAPAEALFPNVDPLGKDVRIGFERFTVIGVFDTRPSPGGFDVGADQFVVIPYTTFARQYGVKVNEEGRGTNTGTMVAAVPREGVSADEMTPAQRDAAYGVFELGMNHPGEIRELTALVRPHPDGVIRKHRPRGRFGSRARGR